MNYATARLLALSAIVASAAAPSVATANGRFPAAQQVVLGPGARSDIVALRTTFGMLVSRDGGRSFRWYCEDLLYFPFVSGLSFDPPVEVSARGDVVLGFEDGAHAITDGCDVTDLFTVSHREITDLAATPDGATLYAAESTSGSRSYILRADASLSFQRQGAGIDGLRFLTVEVAASRPDRVYASGFDESSGRTPRVLRSDDGGAHFDGVLRFEDVPGPPFCASPSEGTAICNDRWPAFRSSIEPVARPDAGAPRDVLEVPMVLDAAPTPDRPAPMDVGAAPADTGAARVSLGHDCGCHSVPAPDGNGYLALLAIFIGRRRRVSIATELQ